MNDFYSPHTGEHIQTDDPAAWMGRASVAAPVYDRSAAGCFWRGDAWEIIPASPATPPVPELLAPLQALLAIDAAGYSSAYEQWSRDPARTFSERAFIEKAQVWRRDDPILQQAAADLGIDDAALDALFIAAGGL